MKRPTLWQVHLTLAFLATVVFSVGGEALISLMPRVSALTWSLWACCSAGWWVVIWFGWGPKVLKPWLHWAYPRSREH